MMMQKLNDGLDDLEYDYPLAIIDSDTVAFTSCLECELKDELLPESFYTEEELTSLKSDPGYSETEHCIYSIDLDEAIENAVKRVEWIRNEVSAEEVFLVFSGTRNFRHDLIDTYKANRKCMHRPEGLIAVKEALLDRYEGHMCNLAEADDECIFLKKQNPDAVLCSVDKDLLYTLPGRHFNYYRSFKHSIEPRWMEVDKATATRWPYIQTLTGDSTDGIQGIKGIGPKKAEKLLGDETDPKKLWEIVVEAYENAGMTEEQAILTMRLVNTQQLYLINGEYKIILWQPPKD